MQPHILRDIPPHQQTLRQWLRRGDGETLLIAPRQAYGDLWGSVGRYTPAAVDLASRERLLDVGSVTPRGDLRFKRHRTGLLVYRDGEDRPSGASLHGTLWVRPDARRAGLGAELLLANTAARLDMGAADYAVNGFRSRLGSHRLAVERAIRADDAVPEEVLGDYREAGRGRLALADPQWEGAIRQALQGGGRIEHAIRPR